MFSLFTRKASTVPAASGKETPKKISFEDYLAITEVDYSIVGHSKIENMPMSDFVAMMSSPKFLGDPLVRTQHLMGASKYERVSDTEIIGHHQIRAAHQRYTGADRLTVENRGHGHSFIKHWYQKVDGEWKLSGLCPQVYWNEHNFEKIFVQLKAEH
ncbi:hypothetical protein MMC27_004348 [Xylographa pallens]|nr:hypothetical protein [Xylographa pallens]